MNLSDPLFASWAVRCASVIFTLIIWNLLLLPSVFAWLFAALPSPVFRKVLTFASCNSLFFLLFASTPWLLRSSFLYSLLELRWSHRIPHLPHFPHWTQGPFIIFVCPGCQSSNHYLGHGHVQISTCDRRLTPNNSSWALKPEACKRVFRALRRRFVKPKIGQLGHPWEANYTT